MNTEYELRHTPVEERQTARIEAFSDGVFAIAITLLVLDLKIPESDQNGDLLHYLVSQGASYLAFVTSFATIGIMWVNHHRLFSHIKRSNHALLFLNNLLLLGVTVVPWPTSLLARYLGESNEVTNEAIATMLYNGWFVLISIAFNLLWRYAFG